MTAAIASVFLALFYAWPSWVRARTNTHATAVRLRKLNFGLSFFWYGSAEQEKKKTVKAVKIANVMKQLMRTAGVEMERIAQTHNQQTLPTESLTLGSKLFFLLPLQLC